MRAGTLFSGGTEGAVALGICRGLRLPPSEEGVLAVVHQRSARAA